MSGPSAFLAEITSALERHGIRYMLAGSMASSFHGEPRATRDVDIVIECDETAVRSLVDEIESADWYASLDAALAALRGRGMFNVIDPKTGWKADLIFRKSRPFSEEEFRRRVGVRVLGPEAAPIPVASPEDTIITKLEWHRDTGSSQQFRDAVGVAAVCAGTIDRAYLRRWANDLGIHGLLEAVLAEAERVE